MELKLQKDVLCVNEMVLDASAEQSVELDYFLPDYHPNIFKLLKTRILPNIQSQKISGSKLYIDGVSTIRVLYLAEETNQICSIEQTVPFSKTIDLPAEYDSPIVRVTARCYFVNARAVNQRRLDIRGGISCKVKCSCQKDSQVLCGAQGGGIQLHTCPVHACGKRKGNVKQFTVSEDLELGHAKPPFASLLHHSCVVSLSDYKIIANKVICKGDLLVHLLYLPTGEKATPEVMDYSIPISQIIDLPGVEEEEACDVRFTVASFSCEPKNNDDGDCRMLCCEFVVFLNCVSDKNKEMLLTDDAFSTRYETRLTQTPFLLERFLTTVNHTAVLRQTIELEPISAVYDLFCNLNEYTARPEDGALKLSGMLEATAFCCDKDGMAFSADKTLPIEVPIEGVLYSENLLFQPAADILSVSYSIQSETTVELRAEIRITGTVYEKVSGNAITDLTIDETAPQKQHSPCALRLYYGEESEEIWEIARHFGTSMSAVMEENSLEEERLPEKQMLLIPMVEN